MDWFGRQEPMPSFGRFWLRRLISRPKSYRDCQETGQWTSTALFRYRSLLYEEFLLEERTGGIWVQI